MDHQFYGNSLTTWAVAFGIAAAMTTLLYAVRYFVQCRLQKLSERTNTKIDDIFVKMLGSTYLVFIAMMSLYVGSLKLDLPADTKMILSRLAVAAFLVQAALWGDAGMRAWRVFSQDAHGVKGSHASVSSIGTLFFVARMILWTIVALMILDNMGVNITTLVASLGVGGIAVALAVQNILGDLFASLSIVMDKPFVVGDSITVGDASGTVEYIGVKTTRLRSITGEQIVFSNAELLKMIIHNQRRMETRRVSFTLKVTYETSPEQLAGIPAMVKEIIEGEPNTAFNRAHLSNLGDSSIDYTVVYHIEKPEMDTFMDAQQSIYLKLIARFAAEGIEFAYPTSVVKLVQAAPVEEVEEEAEAPASAPPVRAFRPR
ncbi:MAG: mechanosensitive ion channel family protein [Telluria sp.]